MSKKIIVLTHLVVRNNCYQCYYCFVTKWYINIIIKILMVIEAILNKICYFLKYINTMIIILSNMD